MYLWFDRNVAKIYSGIWVRIKILICVALRSENIENKTFLSEKNIQMLSGMIK